MDLEIVQADDIQDDEDSKFSKIIQDSIDDEIVKDSMDTKDDEDSIFSKIVQDSMDLKILNLPTDCGFALNKFPDDDDDESSDEKGLKVEVRALIKIYLPKFY
ncbi:hypothetical protein JHK82_015484 [Glycine max]|nr:hypothetical protein JHK86_015506 [Glycine max]KAG5148603.1 hypothetical protein JHK82_015484 [Glycine max]